MTEHTPRLTRKPFGYDTTIVDNMLADQRSMLSSAERRVREAETAVARLEEQLDMKDAFIKQLQESLAERPEPQEAPAAPEPPQEEVVLSPRFMSDEMAKIISAAEDSTNQILQRARRSTQDQILEADRLWREVQDETIKFANWREAVEGVVHGLESVIFDARDRIESIPQRMQDALAPAVEIMVKVEEGLGAFSEASVLPLLVTASGLEEARRMARGDEASPSPDGSSPGDMVESSWVAGSQSDWSTGDEDAWSQGGDGFIDSGLDFVESEGEPAPPENVEAASADHDEPDSGFWEGLTDVG